jgi:Arm DNA-binding domain
MNAVPTNMLEDEQIRGIQPVARPFKLTDGRGLYLLVMPNGSRYWHYKYRLDGKQKTLALGVYPKVSIDAARTGRDEARTILANGGDPMAAKREAVKQKGTEKVALPTFRLSMAGDAITIQTRDETLKLTPEQTVAVRSFLIATPSEAKP